VFSRKLAEKLKESELGMLIIALENFHSDNELAQQILIEKLRSVLMIVNGMGNFEHSCWIACRPD